MALNANYFFIIIALILASILLFFKPIALKKSLHEGKEVPALELHDFTLYEVGLGGLKDIMIGKDGFRYADRLEVNDINYTDSSRKLQNNLLADFGVYDNKELITLKGNVRYYREDGMHFKANKTIIDQKKETMHTVGSFTLSKASDNVVGENLFYDTKKSQSRAKDVTAYFTLPEEGE